jgi:hypothetical protein
VNVPLFERISKTSTRLLGVLDKTLTARTVPLKGISPAVLLEYLCRICENCDMLQVSVQLNQFTPAQKATPFSSESLLDTSDGLGCEFQTSLTAAVCPPQIA